MQDLMTMAELAAYLGVPQRTLYQWRTRGVGPVGMKIGRHVRYRRGDVEKWLDERAAAEHAS